MKILKQVNQKALVLGRSSYSLIVSKAALIAILALAGGLKPVFGGVVTLKASDAAGTSSYTGSANWNPAGVPTAGNTYLTGAFTIRTINNTTSGATNTFAGDSLEIDTGGRLLAKVGNNVVGNTTWDVNAANYILNGGIVDQAGVNTDLSVCLLGGTVTVNSLSYLGALGGTSSGNASYETLNIIAPISGSAALQVNGATLNSGGDTGVVEFSNNNTNYTGTITVTNANGGIVASAAGRILLLNNLNAVSDATLNLVATAVNPVGFSNAVNTAAFNVGALSGSSSEALSDTAGGAVTVSVGGNNANSTFNGALTGIGRLIKVGTGTLTLNGSNTYTGNTTINGGTLALGATARFTNSSITIGAGATFDVSSNAFTLVAGQNLLGNGTVKGAVTVAAGATVYANAGAVYGTNMFTTNVTFLSGGQAVLNLGTAYNGTNDLIVIGGNLALNSTTFTLNAPDPSLNLDQAGDYTLVKVGGTITGNPLLTWGVAPANAAHYSIVKSGGNVVLRYNASLVPAGNGTVSPNPVLRNQPALITVTVTFNSNPINSVMVDASQLGGSSSLSLVAAGGGVYTNSVTVAPNLAAGTASLVASITDSASNVGSTAPFTVTINTSSDIWNGLGANDSWGTSPNWQSGFAPGNVGDALTFAGTTRLTPSMDANYTITSLTFDGTAGAFTLNGNGNLLTLGGGLANNSANTQTLNLPVADAGNFTDVSGGANVVVNGGISGTGGLQNDDSATLILQGTNSFAGGININSGTLQIAGAGLLGGTNGIYAGNITNSGVLQYSSSATQTLAGVVSYFGSVLKDGSGKLTLAGANTYFAATTINGGVLQVTGTLAADLGNSYVYGIVDNGTLEWSSASVQTLGGVISGTGGLLVDGSGTLNLNAANTYTGNTVISGGTLVYSPNTVGYSTINGLTINGGGKVTVNANNGTPLPVSSLTLNSNSLLNLSYDFSGGNPTAAAVGATTISRTGTNTIRISGFGAAVGQFPLISYTSAPLANLNNLVLVLPPGLTANLVNNTGSSSIDLNVTGSSPSTWIALTATDAAGTSSFNSAGNWSNASQPATGNGYYTQGFTLRSPADTNSYTFGGSALSIDQYTFGNAGGRLLLKGTGPATITVPNLILNGGLVDFANGADGATKTLAGSILLNNGTTSYLGALTSENFLITAPITGGGNLQIGGANVNGAADTSFVALFGTNTYSGLTTVATGVLSVDGPTANTSVVVLTNATFGGLGSVGGTVTVQPGATVAPGIYAHGTLTPIIGTLTVSGAVSVSGTVQLRLVRTNSPSSDELVAPAITINPGATLTLLNTGSTNFAAGDTFALFSTPVNGSFSVTNLPVLPNPNLYWTNNLALNGTIAVATMQTVNTNPTNITTVVSGNTLTLSWPADHLGWKLQVQTNSLATGLGTNWVTIPGSSGMTSTNIIINPANGSAFYRLTYP
ncbi:MAG TPA: autotransporter-associated beta strand repeat-containing protein [Verrucomicrobiae bacterium]|nr:autotransporter-associated beta strand repeat-containing protein [Verrucomicrobiae bacterium]